MQKYRLFPIFCALMCLLGTADARPGGGASMGSRGSHTWSAPPRTSITPGWARPMDRTATPRSNFSESSPRPMPYGATRMGYRPPFAARHPFMTGFLGGMLGAGLFGLLSGHGLFWGLHGLFSLIGFLFQALIIAAIIAFIIRMFSRRNNGNNNAKSNPSGNYGAPTSVTLQPSDYQAFQKLLLDIQAAWSAQNMSALATMITPEMAGYFNEQLSNLSSRGARNIVSNVQFQHGDLSEAWREGSMTYTTVAMRYSMIDVTTDSLGNVIDGSSTDPVTVTELWTFVRADGRGNWVLSAIQQAG